LQLLTTGKKSGRKKGGRKNGEGYLYKRKGWYYLQIQVNGKRKPKALGTKKLEEAQERAKDYLKPIAATSKEEIALHIGRARRLLSEKEILLKDVWAEYIGSTNRPDSGARTLRDYEGKWNQFTTWLEAEYPNISNIAQIEENIALRYAAHLKSIRKLAPASYNSHRNLLSLITNTLARRAGIFTNPWESVSKRTLDTVEKKELSEDEVKRILDKLDNPDFKISNRLEWQVVFRAGTFAGLRLADAVLMKWDCVDWNKNELSLIPKKTIRKQRRVNLPIHPSLREKLVMAEQWQQNDIDYVCPNLAKRYNRNPAQIDREAVAIFSACDFQTSIKLERRNKASNIIGFHSLRYSFVSFCANAGIPLAVVQSLIGHGSPAMTRHYTHISRESAENAINALPVLSEANTENKLTDTEKLQAIAELVEKSPRGKLAKGIRQLLG
jgi:integrase